MTIQFNSDTKRGSRPVSGNWGIYRTIAAICITTALSACSTLTPTGENISVDATPANTMVTFDQKLANIEDTDSAEAAVEYFVDHVRTTLSDEKTPIQTKSLSLRNKIKQFAEIESVVRGKGGDITVLADDMVSPDKVAEVMSQVVDLNGTSRDFTGDQVKQTQDVVRANLPHLAQGESPQMTPLEASVIAYYMLTGDTGQMDPSDTTI